MRTDILQQAQAIRTSIDNVTGTMADAAGMMYSIYDTSTK